MNNSSQDIFEDCNVCEHKSDISSKGPAWRGVPLDELKGIAIFDNFLPVRPSPFHHVFFKVPLVDGQKPEPFPVTKNDVWDADHVRMPHSAESLFPVSESELKPRWELIKSSLSKPIKNSKDLEDAIFSYNSKSSQKWSLDALHEFFSETFTPEETEYFFSNSLPDIIKLALEIETAFKGSVPLLKKGESRSISISQEQAGILLANAFLSTFPRRNTSPTQFSKYPTINFMRLFQTGSLNRVQEKIKCFINYFRRICRQRPSGVITYSRRHINPNALPIWSAVDKTLPQLYISSEGTIEEGGSGLIEIDFANKSIGGGVLGRGSVQEEIKFVMCPELVVARLFTEVLDDTEALIVIGCERFNNYEGYANTFTWAGNYVDETERDQMCRLKAAVIAIDATKFGKPQQQYSRECINRELNKAYAGFSVNFRGAGIATGNWGCGAFRGDPRLKSLLQLMAAAVTGKPIAYFTFGDPQLRDDIFNMWSFLNETSTTVGILWKVIGGYIEELEKKDIGRKYRDKKDKDKKDKEKKDVISLYDYIYSRIKLLTGFHKKICLNRVTGENAHEDMEIEDGNQEGEECNKESEWKEVGVKEPVAGKTCSLKTIEGRKKCLESEAARWQAYRDAISSYSAVPNKTPAVKRKISDYFKKSEK